MKLALNDIGLKTKLSEALKHFLNIFFIFLQRVAIDQDVVEVNYTKYIKIVSQSIINIMLE